MLWTLISLIVLILYLGLIIFYAQRWKKLTANKDLRHSPNNTRVSIVIIGRNERGRIIKCVKSILNNDYPSSLYEIIYVDDHSNDDSIHLLNSLESTQLKILRLQDYNGPVHKKAYKKAGIDYALSECNGDLILHTDADTIVNEKWIQKHVESYESGSIVFTAAPVLMKRGKGFLAAFQQLDLLITMGITGAGIDAGFHFLANGANMSYSRKEREQIELEESNAYASGDDVFLVQEMARKNPGSIAFESDLSAVVHTFPENNWKAFFRQRFRWAGKSSAYKDRILQLVEVLVFTMNLSLLINFILLLFSLEFYMLFLSLLLVKSVVDLSFIQLMSTSFKQRVPWYYLLLAILFYPIYYLIVGFSALLPFRVDWKGRKI